MLTGYLKVYLNEKASRVVERDNQEIFTIIMEVMKEKNSLTTKECLYADIIILKYYTLLQMRLNYLQKWSGQFHPISAESFITELRNNMLVSGYHLLVPNKEYQKLFM